MKGRQQQKHKKQSGGAGKKRPGGGARKPQRKAPGRQKGVSKLAAVPKQTGLKRKAPAEPASQGGASGDMDDFAYMLDEMEDYAGPAQGEEEGSLDGGQQSDLDSPAGSGGSGGGGSRDEQQQKESGGGGGAGEGAGAEGQKAKKRRKRGQKLSALEFEASRQMARQIAECSAEEQADWLWNSFQQHAAASSLERGSLTADGVAPLPAHGSLEERLKALEPAGGWQAAYCSREGPAGSPALLLVSASAIGAVNLIRLCPNFNKACKIGKLFAKHMKVPEQEEALRTQVMCIAAGTPNRLCKLADSGALRLDRLTHVVLDVQLDVKQRDILAIPETRADFWQFFQRHLKARLDAGSVRLSLVNSDRL